MFKLSCFVQLGSDHVIQTDCLQEGIVIATSSFVEAKTCKPNDQIPECHTFCSIS